MLPIATLPAAGLLVRLGQADMLGADGLARNLSWLQPVADIFAAAGGAVFDNLPLIFAVGVAVGFAKKADGSTGVAGLFGYLIYRAVTWIMSPIVMGKPEPLSQEALDCLHSFDPAKGEIVQVGPWNQGIKLCDIPTQTPINYGVLGGIIIGVVAALLWQRYYRIKLPDWLAFFGGRRFVPIVTSGAAVNRLLIPFGLHHLLNSVPWFQLGSCQTASGGTAHGDLTCFFQGVDGSNSWTGSFMTGFFPIMMFALPAAALAIWHTAKPAKRKATGALMISVALTAFITGITEPLEYAFAYVAFPIYAVHAVLTGSSLAVANLLGAKDGFSFAAGAIDYLLNFGKSAELSGGVVRGPLMIVIMGLVYAVIYYFLFRFLIIRFNFKTPGREDDDVDAFAAAQAAAAKSSGKRDEDPHQR